MRTFIENYLDPLTGVLAHRGKHLPLITNFMRPQSISRCQ